MPLKVKITKEEYEALNDGIKSEYKADGNNFKLDVDDAEIAAEMRRGKERSKIEAEEYKARAEEAERRLAEAEGTDARKRGDIDAIETSWKNKLSEAQNNAKVEIEKRNAQLAKLLVNDVANAIAADISTSPKVMLPHIRALLQADLDGDVPKTRVLDEDGKPTAMTVDELKKKFIDNPDFAGIIIGSKASGSGGSGGNQGSGATKQPSEYTEQERKDLYQKNPSEFRRIFNTAS